MKKIIIFFVITLIIICIISGLYINYKANYNLLKRENLEFERYLNKEIYGTELSTLINKVINNNEKNKNQSKQDNYLINIEIKFSDNKETYKMETIYNGGIQNFVSYYGNIKFKCIEVKYYKSTSKIEYLLFEQTTE